MNKHNLLRIFSFILALSLALSIVACSKDTGDGDTDDTGDRDTVAMPTLSPDCKGIICPKCGEEKCDVFTSGETQGYKCRVCFTKFGFFEPTTVEVMTDNKGFYLLRNGDLCNVMFTTYYMKDADNILIPGIRICDLEREEQTGVLVFNSTNGWAALTIDKTEDGVISGNGEIYFDKICIDIGATTCSNVSSVELTDGKNLFGEQGTSVLVNPKKISEKYIVCEDGNIKLDLSSFTTDSKFANLYIQNSVVIEGTLDDEFSYANGSKMYMIAGHDKDVNVTISIHQNQVIHGEEGDYSFAWVSINAEYIISGETFVLENHEMMLNPESN